MSLFNRRIEIDINSHGDGVFRLVTTLGDLYHDIVLTLMISDGEFRIAEAVVETNRIPHPRCREIRKLAGSLTGVTVGPGFLSQIRSRLGGKDGCPNLLNLVLLTAPLVVNASAIRRLQHENLSPEQAEAVWQETLSGVCVAYPEKERQENRPNGTDS
ncbi:MAG: DUF2889 domain-containing protein [Dethiobacter sp.]|nr:DUF2889 domain-containing protein [Dethiobacter sp.]MBS3901417.1 DUF2889 domain-containing protein [Dethiobacter sp.]MBS3988649.1 DUF2889 domain-containing protein [Dethiobacter sp.]